MIVIENQGYGDFLIKMTVDPAIVQRVIDRVMPYVFDCERNVDNSVAWAYTCSTSRQPGPFINHCVQGYGGDLITNEIHVACHIPCGLDGTKKPDQLNTTTILDVAFVIRQLMKE